MRGSGDPIGFALEHTSKTSVPVLFFLGSSWGRQLKNHGVVMGSSIENNYGVVMGSSTWFSFFQASTNFDFLLFLNFVTDK